MSGGFDSTAAACLLLEKGYEVVGLTLDMLDPNLIPKHHSPFTEQLSTAKSIAEKLGIQHHVITVHQDFKKKVIDNFVTEYMAGRTPNPCIRCNRCIKWKFLAEKAGEFGCKYIATGHYARKGSQGNTYTIQKAVDTNKDQSYFLWGLDQKILGKTFFPLGNHKKTALKNLIWDAGLEIIMDKKESMEICFVPDNDYRALIRTYQPEITQKLSGGRFLDATGAFLGNHKGYPFYTIGQRRGLEIAAGYPLYVQKIIPQTNTIILGNREKIYHEELFIHNLNFIVPGKYAVPFFAKTKVRYNHSEQESWVYPETESTLKIKFEKPVFAITPGQSAVFYDKDELIGGGIIAS